MIMLALDDPNEEKLSLTDLVMEYSQAVIPDLTEAELIQGLHAPMISLLNDAPASRYALVDEGREVWPSSDWRALVGDDPHTYPSLAGAAEAIADTHSEFPRMDLSLNVLSQVPICRHVLGEIERANMRCILDNLGDTKEPFWDLVEERFVTAEVVAERMSQADVVKHKVFKYCNHYIKIDFDDNYERDRLRRWLKHRFALDGYHKTDAYSVNGLRCGRLEMPDLDLKPIFE